MNHSKPVFVCPLCKGELTAGENNGCFTDGDTDLLGYGRDLVSLRCPSCNEVFPVVDGIWDSLPRNSPHRKYLGFYEGDGVSLDKTGVARLNAQQFKVSNVCSVLPPRFSAAVCLDVGCGGGWFLEEFLKRVAIKQGIGIDISFPRLRKARTNLPQAILIRGDVEYIPLSDDAVGLITALDVIEHIENPAALLAEIFRLAPRLVIKFPIEDTVFERFRAKLQWLKRIIRNEPPMFNPHLHCFTVKRAYQLLKKAGFKVKNELLIDLPFDKTFMHPPAYGITGQTPLPKKAGFYIKRAVIKFASQLAYLFLAPFFTRICNCGLYLYAERQNKT